MSTSITEDILSSNRLYTDTYLKNTINLTKSVVIKNDKEARLYNQFIELNYPNHKVDESKVTWRYYKHLSGQYHSLDKPMELISVDNGSLIELNINNIRLNKNTHKELLKYSYYYEELVNKYPEQELLIKTLLATSPRKSITTIIGMSDYTVVNYNSNLVEENEEELIHKLQERIDNYKVTKLLHQYTTTDSLFLASQYHVLYSYIVTSLLSLRLENAKTPRAHSYHILNYLSSQHYLDLPYRHLTKRQALYLYRNLLFLNNHSGSNLVQESLIENLFNERNISVVNYKYEQTNKLNPDNSMEYFFKQELMNKKDLVYSQSDFTLGDLSNREINQAKHNKDIYNYTTDKINDKLLYSLSNKLPTKNLETIITDVTDSVKYKLIPTMVDYWAFLIKEKLVNFLVAVTDPINNGTVQMNTTDLFKLYTILLYKVNHLELTSFPSYRIKRVFKRNIPTTEELRTTYYRLKPHQVDVIDEVVNSIVPYEVVSTAFGFSEFISSIYKLNIGLWLLESNVHDKDDNGQLANTLSRLQTHDTLTMNDETPQEFLYRIGLEDLYEYPLDVLEVMSYNILDSLFDNKLDLLNKYKFIQKALVEIFKKFTSYTTQLLDDYTYESSELGGVKDTRYTTTGDIHEFDFKAINSIVTYDMLYRIKDRSLVRYNNLVRHSNEYRSVTHVSVISKQELNFTKHNHVFVNITPRPVYLRDVSGVSTPPATDSHLKFLAFNPLD